MKRTISLFRWPLAASAALFCLLPLGLLGAGTQKGGERPAGTTPAAVEPEKDLDVRSGEKALRLLLETDDLNPVRKRGMEIDDVVT